MEHAHHIAHQLNISPRQAAAAIGLLDEGNTIPFIARYRKEATHNLDEEQLRLVSDILEKLRSLDERRRSILKSLEEQGNLSNELQQQIESAPNLTALEDLYAPFRPKRRTRASVAKERGLQPLAELILQQAILGNTLDELAEDFLNEQVPSVEDAWSGARDIVAEWISDHPEIRQKTREQGIRWGTMQSSRDASFPDEKRIYELYYAFEMRIEKLRPHQVLALNRGEAEKCLKIKISIPERDWRNAIEAGIKPNPRSCLADQLELAIKDSAERLLLPAIERDLRRLLTERAEEHAIRVFAENLRGLLNQPPLTGHIVLGIDPGFRTGCKIAVIDQTGKVLETGTIYPHEPRREWDLSLKILIQLTKKHNVTLIAIGNGTASRETEQLAAELTRTISSVSYLIVSEAGASVYSASALARAELPGLDVSLRGAVSIARRVQDPLAELVKIEPKAIGVGLYQHDVDQKQLSHALAGVVESVVNAVGVDLNTASPALLTYVSGIGPKLAEKIISERDARGIFPDRKSLLTVPGLGPKAFEQAAGFLRVRESKNPLDASAIHPESYSAAEKLLELAGLKLDSSIEERKQALEIFFRDCSGPALAEFLGIGLPTLQDMIEQLLRPGRDPRQDLPLPMLRSDVLKLEDLVVGMQLKGTVRNVVDFGAFVDIGVKQDGLLHRSQLPEKTFLRVGQVIDVKILKIEIDRGRIGLGWAGDAD